MSVTGFWGKARWSIADGGYATFWQLRSAASRARASDYHGGNRRPIVLIPGVYESWQFLRPLIVELHKIGYPVHVIAPLRHNRRSVADAARIVMHYATEQDLRDFAIVAHSKGGLIGKYAMLRLDADRRISHMIAISAPFSGSRYARRAPVRSLRAFAPVAPLVRTLAQEREVNQRITSVFGVFDPVIPDGSVLPDALNVQVKVGGHFRIVAHRETIREVLLALGRLP